jgi:hypothetical protein
MNVPLRTPRTQQEFFSWATSLEGRMPEISIEIPVAEFYEDITFGDEASATPEPFTLPPPKTLPNRQLPATAFPSRPRPGRALLR